MEPRYQDADHAIALQLELMAGLLNGASTLDTDEWWAVLRRLNPADGRVVVLKVLHGLTNKQTAERLEVSHGMIDLRWQRAIGKLNRQDVAELLEVA